jgi:hypothetical protein
MLSVCRFSERGFTGYFKRRLERKHNSRFRIRGGPENLSCGISCEPSNLSARKPVCSCNRHPDCTGEFIDRHRGRVKRVCQHIIRSLAMCGCQRRIGLCNALGDRGIRQYGINRCGSSHSLSILRFPVQEIVIRFSILLPSITGTFPVNHVQGPHILSENRTRSD